MHVRHAFRLAVAMTCLSAAALPEGPAQDWPQWRGPDRDGAATVQSAPVNWPAQLHKKWQTQVGAGHSSPVAAGSRAYLHTRQGEEEVVSSFDLTSGKPVWTDRYPAPYTMNPAATAHGKGPKSTPVLSGGRLYTFGISGILSCYDAATGRVRWRKETGSPFRSSSPLYGSAMSPLVDGSAVIAHTGGHDSGALVALDVDTGARRWSWNGDGPAYASPIVVDIGGTRQVVTQSQRNIVGVSAADGTLLWKVPFSTPYDQNAVTPVRYRDLLVFSGLDQGVTALKVSRAASQWKVEKAWANQDVSFYTSTPVLCGDLLVGLSHRKRGQIACLDARTGKGVWTGDGRTAEYMSAVRFGNVILLLSDAAELTVGRVSAGGLEVLRRYTVARSPTWAYPAVTGRGILIKDVDTLALWGVD